MSVIDPNIYVQVTPELLELLREDGFNSESLTESLGRVLAGEQQRLTTTDLKWIKTNMSREGKSRLYSVLAGCRVDMPELVYPERSAELEARCQKLKAEQAEREYRKMTQNIRKEVKGDEKSIASQMKEINSYIILLVQFLVSVLASFLFGYLMPYYIRGITDVGPRILTGIVIAFVVAIADMYFVIRQMLDEDGIRFAKKTS